MLLFCIIVADKNRSVRKYLTIGILYGILYMPITDIGFNYTAKCNRLHVEWSEKMKIYSVEAEQIKEMGATGAIQRNIDEVFSAGGGEVQVPAGDWHIGSIRLRSRVTLHLLENAHLIASRDPNEYEYHSESDIEPVPPEERTDVLWEPWNVRKNYDFMMKPISRWNRAMIRAIDATDISIIGEKGAYLDGMDCYDALGEERYRGPHAINIHRCKNVVFRGYIVKNSGNWAHALFECENIAMENVQVLAGHDGIHVTSCDNVTIRNCDFQTGDDCVAGIDNLNVLVSDCRLNTACSAFRFGGTNVTVRNCRLTGPARYLFRGGLSEEEKKSGVIADSRGRVCNMLSAFTYYSDFSRPIRQNPGNITIEDCVFHNTTRFLHYNFSGNEPWQRNRPLEDITFRRIFAEGISMPLTLYGDRERKVVLKIEDSVIAFDETSDCELIRACYYDWIMLRRVTVKGLRGDAMIRKWCESGEVRMEEVSCENFCGETEAIATEPFVCKTI